ncbi:MAG: iron-sulfur cluster assembly scaffold protein [Candidatus Competibacteraceae bacterium]|nr:iron-sulfur cluster assembly scaffold protein [Candidatus Competibacteraceae bacterium]
MSYSDIIREHFDHPRNVGTFLAEERTIGTGRKGAPALGNMLQLQIKVMQHPVIADTRFKAYGNVGIIAAASWVSEWLKGKTLEQAADIDNALITEQLALPATQIQSAVLVEAVVIAAVADYQAKQADNA